MSLILLLARHGETTYNAENRYQGQRDITLSPVGRAQARRLGQRLASAQRDALMVTEHAAPRLARPLLPVPLSAIYTSNLQRADETARLIGDALRADGGPSAPLPIHTLPQLAERNFGAWEGLTPGEIRAAFPGETEPQNGEPWPVVWERMASALDTIRQAHPSSGGGGDKADETVLVVGHGGSLRAYVCRALGVGYEHVRRFRLDNASLSATEFWQAPSGGEQGRVLLLNDTAHLFAPAGPVSPD